MSENKPASKQTLALLGIGSAFAIGAAYWSITSALAPPPVPHANPAPAGAAGRVAPVTSNPPAAIPGALPGSAADEAARGAASSATRNDSVATARVPPAPEALMAPEADPFAPLRANLLPRQSDATGRSVGALTGMRRPEPFTFPRLNPILSGPPIVTPRAPALAVVQLPTPELVGTLLGDEPSAVFRGQSQLVAVPVGGIFAGWRVVTVNHGGAVIRGMGRTLRLGMSSSYPSPSSDAPEPDASVPAERPQGASPASTPAAPEAQSDSAYAVATTGAGSLQPESGNVPVSRTQPADSGISAGDTTIPTADETSLPVLRDNPMRAIGQPAPQTNDSAMPADATISAPEHADQAIRPASGSAYRPFRQLVAADGESDSRDLPPRRSVARSEVVIASNVASRKPAHGHHRTNLSTPYQSH